MKKLLLLVLLSSSLLHTSFTDGYQTDEMIQLANTVAGFNGNAISSWQVTMKEHMNSRKLNKIMTKLRTASKTTSKEDENSIKYSFRNTHKQENISVVYNAVIPISKDYKPEFIAVIEGSGWNKHIENEYRRIAGELSDDYFSDNRDIFACLKTDPNAIMNLERFLNYMTDEVDFQQINTINDNISQSRVYKYIYGYTPLWNHRLNINYKPVNVQIAQATVGKEKKQLEIGTPILMNEY